MFWPVVMAALIGALIGLSSRWANSRLRPDFSDDTEGGSMELGAGGSVFIACLGIAIILIAFFLYRH